MKNLYFLILLLFFLSGCNNSYQYVEYVEEEDKIRKKEPIMIDEENDSLAYLAALERFYVSKNVSKDLRKKYEGNYALKPVSFSLYDTDGNIVNPFTQETIDFLVQDMEQLDKDMEELDKFLEENPDSFN